MQETALNLQYRSRTVANNQQANIAFIKAERNAHSAKISKGRKRFNSLHAAKCEDTKNFLNRPHLKNARWHKNKQTLKLNKQNYPMTKSKVGLSTCSNNTKCFFFRMVK